MAIIKQLEYVKDNKQTLNQKYNGLYVVISDQLEERSFNSLDEAYVFGVKNFGLGNFLLQRFSDRQNKVQIINQTITAYRYPFPTIVNRILVDCTIGIPHVDGTAKAMKALWDTGATCTCIAQSVAEEIGLVKVNERELIGADNMPFKADVFCVRMQMGHFVIVNIEVCGIPMD